MSRNYKTKSSQFVTLTLLSGGAEEREPASSPYGPVRAGLTITPNLLTTKVNQDQQLLELLNILERKAEILLHKSYEVLDTLITDTTHLVEPKFSSVDTTGIKEVKC